MFVAKPSQWWKHGNTSSLTHQHPHCQNHSLINGSQSAWSKKAESRYDFCRRKVLHRVSGIQYGVGVGKSQGGWQCHKLGDRFKVYSEKCWGPEQCRWTVGHRFQKYLEGKTFSTWGLNGRMKGKGRVCISFGLNWVTTMEYPKTEGGTIL